MQLLYLGVSSLFYCIRKEKEGERLSLNVDPGVIQNYNNHTHFIWGPTQKGGSRYIISCRYRLQRIIRIITQYQVLIKYGARW